MSKCTKQRIPKALREQVWLKTNKHKFQVKCPIRWCRNKINAFESMWDTTFQSHKVEQQQLIIWNLYVLDAIYLSTIPIQLHNSQMNSSPGGKHTQTYWCWCSSLWLSCGSQLKSHYDYLSSIYMIIYIMRLLELFSGVRSAGKIAGKLVLWRLVWI